MVNHCFGHLGDGEGGGFELLGAQAWPATVITSSISAVIVLETPEGM